ncbi:MULTISPECIES: hypothetical protein [Streptosporangium]|uniref:Uncharacterized protein n=1 Tax=Streptosporangium brasiliense TaxID=47480 RepID=A0ABT9RLH8_9ACTN|nr:hypothetical protein [Streptosporangium brasiliense]MDP9869200.1 hypothetical protein [Streptosporangium brasiliense]
MIQKPSQQPSPNTTPATADTPHITALDGGNSALDGPLTPPAERLLLKPVRRRIST